jgi:hypothetical protein
LKNAQSPVIFGTNLATNRRAGYSSEAAGDPNSRRRSHYEAEGSCGGPVLH